MTGTIKKLLIGTSVLASFSVIVGTPALAGTLKNATVTGTASYLTYDADSTNTFLVPNSGAPAWANERKVLDGNSGSPTGNIELFSNSETLSNADFAAYNGGSTLAGTIGGKSITLSSLTAADWDTDMGGGQTLAQKWLNDLIVANNLSPLLGANTQSEILSGFVAGGGLQRFSDPNVAYVNQDNDGTVRIGLAGHFNGAPMIQQALQPTQVKMQTAYNTAQGMLTEAQTKLNDAKTLVATAPTKLAELQAAKAAAPNLLKAGIQAKIDLLTGQVALANELIVKLPAKITEAQSQLAALSAKLDPLTAFINKTDLIIKASEIVKVSYDGGAAQYLYSFDATQSGLYNKEEFERYGLKTSHSGNYEVSLKGTPSESVPEPSAMLGLIAVGGLFAAKRKLVKNA